MIEDGSAGDPDDSVGEPAAASAASSGGPLAAVAGRAKSIGGALVASKLRIALLVLVGLPAVLAVTVGIGFALGVFGVPEVTAVENDFGNVTDEETIIETNVSVQNPNPVGVSLGGVTIDYQVRMNDVGMANGTKNGISIGSGNSTTHLETTMYNDRIPPWWASHVSNRERTQVVIDAEVASSTLGQRRTFTREREIQTDILGQFASDEDRPIDGNLPLLDDPLLVIQETGASWGSVTREETPLNMDFTMYNPNTEPYAISELRYDISMNHVQVAEGATEDPFVIPGRTTNTLHATTAIQNGRLDEWWVSHLNESRYGHQVTLFRIDFTAVVELPNGETVTVPLDDLTYREWIGTDVLGEGGSTGEPPEEMPEDDGGLVGGGSDDGSTDDGSGTDGGDGSTDDGSGTTDGGSTDGGSGGDSGGNDSDDDGGILSVDSRPLAAP
jgi:LEA14-like dessication related protein